MGRDNRGRVAGRGSLLRAGSSHFARSRRRRRSGNAPARTRRLPRGTPTPLAGPRSSGRGGSPPRHNTRCPLRPPCFPCPPEGQKEEEEEVPGRETPEGVSARGEVSGAGGTEPEGREGFLRSLYARFLTNCSHCATDQSAQMSHVMSMVQILPLQLVQVGWGSRLTDNRKAPHFLSPTPGQICITLDIAKK